MSYRITHHIRTGKVDEGCHFDGRHEDVTTGGGNDVSSQHVFQL